MDREVAVVEPVSGAVGDGAVDSTVVLGALEALVGAVVDRLDVLGDCPVGGPVDRPGEGPVVLSVGENGDRLGGDVVLDGGSVMLDVWGADAPLPQAASSRAVAVSNATTRLERRR